MRKIIILGISMLLLGIVGCSNNIDEKSTKVDKEDKLEIYDNEEDIEKDCALILEAMDIEENMSKQVEAIMLEYDEIDDKTVLISNSESCKEEFKENISYIKDLESRAKLNDTVELLKMIEKLYKIEYYQASDLSELKYDDVNEWSKIYNEKNSEFEKQKKKTMKLYSKRIGGTLED